MADHDAPTSAADDASAPPAALALRRLNDWLGAFEAAAVAIFLTVLIGVSVYFAFASKLLHSTATWPYEVIRYSVFFVAMAGAALAAQRQGMFNMDLVTRRFGVRTRSYLRICGAILVAVLCAVVVKAGLDLRANAALHHDHEIISEANAVLALVVGFGLIGVHFVLHGLIDVMYWMGGRTPPEPPQGGHG